MRDTCTSSRTEAPPEGGQRGKQGARAPGLSLRATRALSPGQVPSLRVTEATHSPPGVLYVTHIPAKATLATPCRSLPEARNPGPPSRSLLPRWKPRGSLDLSCLPLAWSTWLVSPRVLSICSEDGFWALSLVTATVCLVIASRSAFCSPHSQPQGYSLPGAA